LVVKLTLIFIPEGAQVEKKQPRSTPTTPTYDENVVSNKAGLHSTPTYDDNAVNKEVGLQLVVESILASISEAQFAPATIKDLAAPQSALSKLIVVSK
jgi:hypothetical protein